MTTVAILGAGNVGRALAERMLECGISVRFGVRDAKETHANLLAKHSILAAADVMSQSEAANGADLLMVAVPAGAAVDALRSASPAAGAVVVDCMNPLRWDKGPVWTPPSEGSVAQQLAAAFPDLHVIKGFNHFGAEIQRDPSLATGAADAFFAGDDGDAKSRVMQLARTMGFAAHDAGPLRNAGLLENMAMLWIHLSSTGAGREFAFRVASR